MPSRKREADGMVQAKKKNSSSHTNISGSVSASKVAVPAGGQKSSDETPQSDFVITPGLIPEVLRFEDHYIAAEGKPIMIVGPTGVGKSLFLSMAEKLQRQKNPTGPIEWANCAHFGGQHSDPNIARAELFGAIKGAFWGATNDRKGKVELAEGGLLILEEIGELPLEVQAMLLTFSETGDYRRVGDTKTRNIKCNIIGATNREEELREDFKYRFFPFYVPPLYERRQDILNYMGYRFPDVVERLRPFEIFGLLAYNWPGNVREIERIGRLLRREQKQQGIAKIGKHAVPGASPSEFLFFDQRDTALRISQVEIIFEQLKRHIFPHGRRFLQSFLMPLGLDFDVSNEKCPFKNYQQEVLDSPKDPSQEWTTVLDRNRRFVLEFSKEKIYHTFGLKVLGHYWPFRQAYLGLIHYCHYFLQSVVEDKDLLDLSEGRQNAFPWDIHWYSVWDNPKALKVKKGILNMLAGVNVAQLFDTIPVQPRERNVLFHKLHQAYPSNRFLKSLIPEEDRVGPTESVPSPKITLMSWDQHDRHYVDELLKETKGNKKQAAVIAKVPYQTFISRLKKLPPIA
ncbi:MAG: sigma 54-interacting transcriptional regulator [Syntrophobacteraceae bacterium]|jgi:transcriptional regulator with AAA-type ATPase domain